MRNDQDVTGDLTAQRDAYWHEQLLLAVVPQRSFPDALVQLAAETHQIIQGSWSFSPANR